MSKEIKHKIVDSIVNQALEYQRVTGRKPTSVWLTPDLKTKIESLTYSDIGSLSGEIFQKGTTDALPKIFGLEIRGWDAASVKFE